MHNLITKHGHLTRNTREEQFLINTYTAIEAHVTQYRQWNEVMHVTYIVEATSRTTIMSLVELAVGTQGEVTRTCLKTFDINPKDGTPVMAYLETLVKMLNKYLYATQFCHVLTSDRRHMEMDAFKWSKAQLKKNMKRDKVASYNHSDLVELFTECI